MRTALLAAILTACGASPPAAPAAPAAFSPAPAVPTQAGRARVEAPWARAVPPGTPNSAAFFAAHNGGEALAEIIAAASPAASAVELHTHDDDGGVMRMRQVEAFAIPGRGHLHLAPGGDHVMLIGLVAPLVEGGTVPLTLTFRDGSSLDVQVPVLARPPASGDGSHGAGGHAH
jgi:periplasmic copper chaperone A